MKSTYNKIVNINHQSKNKIIKINANTTILINQMTVKLLLKKCRWKALLIINKKNQIIFFLFMKIIKILINKK